MEAVALVVQAACAIAMLRYVRHRLLPQMGAEAFVRDSLRDVWLPFLAIIPLVAFVIRNEAASAARLWPAVGAPVWVAVAAIGASFLPPGQDEHRPVPGDRVILLASSATGVILLLVAALGRLSLPAGQTAFALLVVLLWLVAPEPRREGDSIAAAPAMGAALGLGLALAAGHAVAAHFALPRLYWASAAVSSATAVLTLVFVVAAAGSRDAIRASLLSAACGVLMSLGLLSLLKLGTTASGVVSTVLDGPADAAPLGISDVVGGLFPFAFEGTALAVLPLAASALRAAPNQAQRLAGLTAMILAVCMMAWRIAALAAV
jgi:hypothetical protein